MGSLETATKMENEKETMGEPKHQQQQQQQPVAKANQLWKN